MRVEPISTKAAIRAQNKDYPAGSFKTSVRGFTLKLAASLNTLEEFGNIIVKKYPNGTIIKLKDVATVGLEPYENDVILRYNGKSSLAVGLI